MSVKVLAKRGTASQIEGASSSIQTAGEIAFATDTKEFYVSDGTQFNKITDLESNGNFYVSGNVGIGTTSPSSALQVVGDGQGDGILVSSVDGHNVGRIYNNNSNAFPVGNLTLSYGTTTPAFINAESNGISIRGGATDTASNNIKFRLYTSEQMRLTPTGLGIGTTSPYGKLHISGSTGAESAIRQSRVGVKIWDSQIDSSGRLIWSHYAAEGGGANQLFTLDDSDRVGIGTTSPSTKLHVDGNIRVGDVNDVIYSNRFTTLSNSDLLITANTGYDTTFTNGGSERMRITSAGNVGIGTTSPSHKLDVSGDVHLNNLQLSDFTGDIYFGVNSANNKFSYNQWLASASGGMVIKNTANASTGHIAFETSTGEALRIIRGGQLLLNGTTTSFSDKLYINGNAYVNGAWRVGTSGTYVGKLYNTSGILTLESDSTRDIQFGSVTNGTAMFIEGTNGNVGINTSSPGSALEVNGTIRTTSTFQFYNTGGSVYTVGTYDASYYKFLTSGTERMRIGTTGNVGIGTTSPAVKLDVADSEPIIRLTDTRNLNVGDWDDVSLGRIQFYTSDTTSPGARTLAEIQAYSGTSAASGPEAQLIFKTSTRTDSSPIQRMVIDSEGRLGLGTTNPHQILTVAGNITQTDNSYLISTRKITARDSAGLSLYNDGGQGIDIKDNNNVIVTSGNVGIGNTSPSYKLDLNGGTENTLASFSSTDQTAQLRIVDSSNVPFFFGVIGTGAYITPTGATPADGISIKDTGNVGIGVASPTQKLQVQGSQVKFTSTTSGENRFMFSSGDDGNNSAFYMYDSVQSNTILINSGGNSYFNGGNVGIGTTSPTEKLHIVGNIKIEDLNPTIKLLDTNGADWDIELEDNHLRFKVGSTEYVRFQNGGNVGIGTTSSAAKLQVVHTDASVDTLRLGRSDNSSYWRINHAGNDFRLFNEAASGADILLGVDSGGNAENNKVGIGTATPSEKLEVSGNIKASGTIKGKMEQMFACSFSDDLGTTKHYLSFTSNAEQTNVHADQAAMVMPYNGRVKAIQLRLSNIDADTTRTFGIETIAPGINMYASSNNWTIEETESYELLATDDFYLVNYVFSNTNHFESGDLLAISIQDAEDAYTASRQTYVNVIIEYDLNNGMGNDTATTKYTS